MVFEWPNTATGSQCRCVPNTANFTGSVNGAGCPVMVVRPKTYAKADLVDVVDAKPAEHHGYTRPHRYSYSDSRVITRPTDWPLG